MIVERGTFTAQMSRDERTRNRSAICSDEKYCRDSENTPLDKCETVMNPINKQWHKLMTIAISNESPETPSARPMMCQLCGDQGALSVVKMLMAHANPAIVDQNRPIQLIKD
ncbi:hypothetical protein K9N68_21815 [Kovacikia minuta CCNUW1]|uniref:hypothetical protein n=1 Tax=Kovacikia minuta TaxID=2931930 RepID=UPI001CCD5BBB|nr:hypothetical protein [Kovacikia minuta]UBF24328.1 hypothetical protein K9N68_21815 [Kovacikia minuta CCNUW1]